MRPFPGWLRGRGAVAQGAPHARHPSYFGICVLGARRGVVNRADPREWVLRVRAGRVVYVRLGKTIE